MQTTTTKFLSKNQDSNTQNVIKKQSTSIKPGQKKAWTTSGKQWLTHFSKKYGSMTDIQFEKWLLK